jgi:hypothetical protein
MIGAIPMSKLDALVKRTRTGTPNGFESATDTYKFDEPYPSGEITKVVVNYRPGAGYQTIVHIKDKFPNPSQYPDHSWGQVKADLDEALRQNDCRAFNVIDPRQSS